MVKKKLSCRAMGLNCSFEVHDESVDEIVDALAEHARRVHKVEATETFRQKARDLVRLVEA